MRVKAILIFLWLLSPSESKLLGIYGPVFEIQEFDLLKVIEDKLQRAEESGKLETLQKELSRTLTKRILSPSSTVIERAKEDRSWTYDPSFIVSRDLTDQKGTLFAKKGERFNPLDRVSFGSPLLIIDGESEDQVTWAKHQNGDIVLTKGSPPKLSYNLNRSVYFDQQRRITQRFTISHVPARISQRDNVLFIEEIFLQKRDSGK